MKSTQKLLLSFMKTIINITKEISHQKVIYNNISGYDEVNMGKSSHVAHKTEPLSPPQREVRITSNI